MSNASLTALSLQPEPTSTATRAAESGAANGGGQAPGGAAQQFQLFLPLVLFMLVFYFLMLRPQQKQRREMDAMLKALKKGDVVRTSGGIRGEITDLNEQDVTLLVYDKVKLNVLRSHIAGRADVAAAAKDKA